MDIAAVVAGVAVLDLARDPGAAFFGGRARRDGAGGSCLSGE